MMNCKTLIYFAHYIHHLVVVFMKDLHVLPMAIPIATLIIIITLALLNITIPSTSQPGDEEYFTVTTVITETQVVTTTATATIIETTTVAMPTTETKTVPITIEVVPTWAWSIIGVLVVIAAILAALFVRKK